MHFFFCFWSEAFATLIGTLLANEAAQLLQGDPQMAFLRNEVAICRVFEVGSPERDTEAVKSTSLALRATPRRDPKAQRYFKTPY